MQRNIIISLGDGFITSNIFMLAVSSSKCDVFYDVSWFIYTFHSCYSLKMEKKKTLPQIRTKNVECKNIGFI